MPLFDTEINPGDVISSDLFQELLLKLEELDGRVSDLEGGGGASGAVVITGFNPTVQQRLGLLLEVIGQNFAIPLSNNVVTVDGEQITQFMAGSTSDLLRFIIPTTISVPEGGRTVAVRVSNTSGSSERLYFLLPEIPATGDPPVFDPAAVTNDDDSPQPLLVNEFCRIPGSNFAPVGSDNVITFTVTGAGGNVVYPRPGEELEIDDSQSDESLIRVRVPDIAEALPLIPRPITLEITVGAHPPVAGTVVVRRVP